METTKKILNSIYYVKENSVNVKINDENLNILIKKLKFDNNSHWLTLNPFGILDLEVKNIIQLLLIYHSVCFCFWQEPKWEVVVDGVVYDGAYAMLGKLVNFVKNNGTNITEKDFISIIKSKNELCLKDIRIKNLISVKEDFYTEIKDITSDEELLDYIIKKYSHFNDITNYKNEKIYFYKLAQLLTSDILHIRKEKEKLKVNCSNLIGCADYKIAQVLRNYGVLEYTENLNKIVDKKTPIESESEFEIEIRANTLVVINEIYNKLDGKIDRIEINDLIWLVGQDKSKMIKPYHRTYSRYY